MHTAQPRADALQKGMLCQWFSMQPVCRKMQPVYSVYMRTACSKTAGAMVWHNFRKCTSMHQQHPWRREGKEDRVPRAEEMGSQCSLQIHRPAQAALVSHHPNAQCNRPNVPTQPQPASPAAPLPSPPAVALP